MPELGFAQAIDLALGQAMAADERVVVFGEDVPLIRRELLIRFGPRRVRACPISEAAFLGAAVGAAMGGLRPVVEIMMVDFIGVALDALLNQAAKVEAFSGHTWKAPMVVRAACAGGYGDGGQHMQALWGLLAGIPGLKVVVPSTPADAAGLMLAAIEDESPVVYLEHKLLSDYWLDSMGGLHREMPPTFEVPAQSARGEVQVPMRAVPIGRAALRRAGTDLVILSVGVGVHRALAAADHLAREGIEAEIVDLRSVSPLDVDQITESARRCNHVLVVDEDYLRFGLSGEIAAVLAEAGLGVKFARLAPSDTLPYSHRRELAALPSVSSTLRAARGLLGIPPAKATSLRQANDLDGDTCATGA